MGQDAWNLMFGTRHNAKHRKGASTDMHVDEGYAGQMVPGYAGPYKNWKGKVEGKPKIRPNGNPRDTYGSQISQPGVKNTSEEMPKSFKEYRRR